MITLDARVVIAHLEVLVGAAKAGRAQEMLADLHAIGIHVADRHDGEPLRLASLRAASGLKLPDCCTLDVAMTTESALATLDDALAKVARQYHVAVLLDPGSGPTSG